MNLIYTQTEIRNFIQIQLQNYNKCNVLNNVSSWTTKPARKNFFRLMIKLDHFKPKTDLTKKKKKSFY